MTMARDFQAHDYSFKHLVRTIMKSNAYRLSSRFEGDWEPRYANYYPRKFVRMLGAAELHDSIVTATARPGSYKSGVNDVATAMELLDPAHVNREVSEFLRAFGQQSRDNLPGQDANVILAGHAHDEFAGRARPHQGRGR